jgi:hypothetical protein
MQRYKTTDSVGQWIYFFGRQYENTLYYILFYFLNFSTFSPSLMIALISSSVTLPSAGFYLQYT